MILANWIHVDFVIIVSFPESDHFFPPVILASSGVVHSSYCNLVLCDYHIKQQLVAVVPCV